MPAVPLFMSGNDNSILFTDLNMALANGSLERTQEEYDELFTKSGFERVAVHKLAGGTYPLYVQEIKPKSS